MGAFAWVTLATNDSYSLGALVLAHSLRRVGTQYDLAVLITPGVTQSMREKLSAVFNLVREVNILDSKDEANLAVLQRPELGITFTKLHCWRLTEYEKCVFVDADALVVRNCDELFEREELSAAPDVGWPDCFNSGVFVFKPSQQTFTAISTFAASQGSFDGADQGLLNMYFSDWAHKDIAKHLPFIYNMCSTATYSYAPAFKQYGANVKIIHFIGSTKPWLQYFDTMTGIVQPPPGCEHLQPLLQMWWNIFCENVHPQLSDVMGGLAGALSRLTMGEARTDEQRAIEDHMRKQNWEQGQIDFMGRDSFDNILKKINETLASAPQRQPSPAKEIRQSKKSSRKSSEVETAVEESEAALPVLETEDQSETLSIQESSEDTCQRTPEIVSPLTSTEQQLTETSSIIVASEVDKTSEQMSTLDKNVSESLDKSVPITEPIDVSQTHVQKGSTEPQVILEVKQTDKKSEISSDLTSLTSPDLTGTEVDKPLAMQEIKTQIVSEAITECPVPIQVAESVLQAEPKETVSEEPRAVIEAVASSIIPSVQESAASVSEALIQPEGAVPSDQIIQPQQLNGDDPFLQSRQEQLLPPIPVSDAQGSSGPDNTSVDQDSTLLQEQSSQSITQQAQPETENQSASIETDTIPSESVFQDVEQKSSEKPKLTVQLPQSQSEKSEDSAQVQTSIAEQQQIVESELPLETLSKIADSLEAPDTEPPVRPNRKTSKDLKIPGTPIVIGPTPPTSPPLESDTTLAAAQEDAQKQSPTKIESSVQSESQVEESAAGIASEPQQLALTDIQTEKLVEPQVQSQPEQASETEKTVKKNKKIVKKSSAESDTPSSPESEGSGKKVVKKVVKKVSKKPKESAEGGGEGVSTEKPKKSTKKSTKTSSAGLEADTTVPETPPPSASSEPPVPPKRKSKSSSSTKVTDKKPDES